MNYKQKFAGLFSFRHARRAKPCSQEERGAGNAASRGCLHLSPLALPPNGARTQAAGVRGEEHGKALQKFAFLPHDGVLERLPLMTCISDPPIGDIPYTSHLIGVRQDVLDACSRHHDVYFGVERDHVRLLGKAAQETMVGSDSIGE